MPKRSAGVKGEDGLFDDDIVHEAPVRKRARPRVSPPLYKALVTKTAENCTVNSSATNDVDGAIILRIKNCLARAKHPTTPEAEAKVAILMASKLMAKFNVSRAEVLEHESPSAHKQYSGESVVSILRVDGDLSKAVKQQSFVNNLRGAMDQFFDCKSYTTAKTFSIELCFYGIAENTVSAAMACEASYNLISEWATRYTGVAKKNSYCNGAADELWRMSKDKKAAEEEAAKKAEKDAMEARIRQEEDQRQAQMKRLTSMPEVVEVEGDSDETIDNDVNSNLDPDSDYGLDDISSPTFAHEADTDEESVEPDFKVEDGDDINPYADLEEEIQKLIKPERPSPTPFPVPDASSPVVVKHESPDRDSDQPTPSGTALEATWGSHMQLVRFRETASKIADDYLKEQGTKLRHRKFKPVQIRDREAYQKGVKDGKTIDVHRKRIEE